MQLDVNILGAEQIQRVLGSLPRTTARKIIMPALRAGAVPVTKQAIFNVRALANKGYATGELEKNIRAYNLKKYRGQYRVGIQVKRKSVNRTKIVNGQPVRIGLYAAVLEYGKENQAPQSWIRSALRSRDVDAYNAVLNYFRKNIYKAVEDAKK